MPFKDKDRDDSDVVTNQGINIDPPEVRREAWNVSLSESPRNLLCQHLDF